MEPPRWGLASSLPLGTLFPALCFAPAAVWAQPRVGGRSHAGPVVMRGVANSAETGPQGGQRGYGEQEGDLAERGAEGWAGGWEAAALRGPQEEVSLGCTVNVPLAPLQASSQQWV